jgi:GT2 family glycosyltransferase
MSKPQLSVIIVSYNTREVTLECLRTLYGELESTPRLRAHVWVVDNASRDDSVTAIEAEFPGVRVIANAENRGFGAANNQAMERAEGDYFLLLNSDAFVHAGAITALMEELENHPQVAVAGPRLLNRDGSLQPSCWRFPSPRQAWLENLGVVRWFSHTSQFGDYHRWPHDTRLEVDYVSGACFLVRRIAWEQSGGFDEAFPLYAEETDWQKRLRDTGWKIVFVPDAVVTHWGGASGHSKPQSRARVFDGLDRYTLKHHGKPGVLLLRAGMIIGSAVRAALWTAATLVPARRPVARQKSQLHCWLLWRQATHWKNIFNRD